MDEKLVQAIIKVGDRNLPTEQALKELDVSKHDVFDPAIRKKKEIQKGTGVKDIDGKEIKKTVHEEVNRIGVPFQKLITDRRVAFMNVGEMELRAKPKTKEGSDEYTDEERLFELVKFIREDNKMQYRETEVARRLQTELQVAKLWYTTDIDKSHYGDLVKLGGTKRARCRILSPVLGDGLFPVFDGFGDLIYFARSYKTKPDFIADPDAKDEEVEKLTIYTKAEIAHFEKDGDVWIPKSLEKHSYGKIPVIYYEQKETPWGIVQPAINRLETLLSNFADTVDYNGAPILAATGTILGMAERGERGKTMQLKEGAKLEYVTWDQAPDAIKLELDTLVNFIYTCTQTPDISTKGMADLAIKSGVGFDRVFIDAQLAARNVIAGGYGECTQRDINLVKAIAQNVIDTSLAKVKLNITFHIPEFKVNDQRETVDTVSVAYQSGLVSQETAVALSGLTDDAGEEYLRITKEADTLGREIGGTV